jgi:hypothetical protein
MTKCPEIAMKVLRYVFGVAAGFNLAIGTYASAHEISAARQAAAMLGIGTSWHSTAERTEWLNHK